MPKNMSFMTGAKNRMTSLFRSLAPYMPFNSKSTRRSKSVKKNATRKGGSKNAWKKLGQRLRTEKVVKNSKLKATAEEFKPNFHSLRLAPKNSNANFTRKENKKMTNNLFRALHRNHINRKY